MRCDNAIELTTAQAAKRLKEIASPIGVALRSLLLAVSRKKIDISLPVFEVRYRYGQPVTGVRSESDTFQKVLAPCASNVGCKSCQRLLKVLHNHRPLTVVLEGSCEEYLDYEQSLPRSPRLAPLRFYSQGGTIGLTRLLNQLYLPSKPSRMIFGQHAARKLISGARSIFFTASVSNPELAKHLEKKLGVDRLQAYFGADWPVGEKRDWGKPFDKAPWSFFRLIEDAALTRTKKEPWRCRLLVVPVEYWAAVLKQYERDAAVQSFLLVLLSEYFLQSRNTRSEYLRQMVVSDKLAIDALAYASRTVHHLVELIRGEYPGFIPHDPRMGDDFGPYTVVYEEMHHLGISKFLESFPFLLRPVHFDQSHHGFVYYSFERPTLIAPVDEIKKFRSFRVLTDKVKGHMQLLKKDRPGLLDSARGAFFLSGGKPRGPGTKGNIERSSYQVAGTIEEDFRIQIQHAKDQGWLLPTSNIFSNTRSGFMNAFVRIFAEESKSFSKATSATFPGSLREKRWSDTTAR